MTPAQPAVTDPPAKSTERSKYDELIDILADGLFEMIVEDDAPIRMTRADEGWRLCRQDPDKPLGNLRWAEHHSVDVSRRL